MLWVQMPTLEFVDNNASVTENQILECFLSEWNIGPKFWDEFCWLQDHGHKEFDYLKLF